MPYDLPIAPADLRLNPPSGEDWGLVSDGDAPLDDFGAIADAEVVADSWGLITEGALSGGVVNWLLGRGYAVAAYGTTATVGGQDATLQLRRKVIADRVTVTIGRPNAGVQASRYMVGLPREVVLTWQKIDTPCQYKVPGAPFEFVLDRGAAVFRATRVLTIASKTMTVTSPTIFIGVPFRDLYVDSAPFGMVRTDAGLRWVRAYRTNADSGEFLTEADWTALIAQLILRAQARDLESITPDSLLTHGYGLYVDSDGLTVTGLEADLPYVVPRRFIYVN